MKSVCCEEAISGANELCRRPGSEIQVSGRVRWVRAGLRDKFRRLRLVGSRLVGSRPVGPVGPGRSRVVEFGSYCTTLGYAKSRIVYKVSDGQLGNSYIPLHGTRPDRTRLYPGLRQSPTGPDPTRQSPRVPGSPTVRWVRGVSDKVRGLCPAGFV